MPRHSTVANMDRVLLCAWLKASQPQFSVQFFWFKDFYIKIVLVLVKM